jgi:hypothetical protein
VERNGDGLSVKRVLPSQMLEEMKASQPEQYADIMAQLQASAAAGSGAPEVRQAGQGFERPSTVLAGLPSYSDARLRDEDSHDPL